MFSGNTGTAVDPPQPSVTDNLGVHLTYTRHEWGEHSVTGREGQCAIWTADVVTSAAMTVTVTNNDNTDRHTAVKVYVLYGAAVSYVGTHGIGSSASANAIAQSYTAAADDAQGFMVTCDWSAVGTETAGSQFTMDASGTYVGGLFSYGFGRRTNPDDAIGGLSTLNVNLPGTSTDLTWAYIEIIPFVGDPAEKDPPPYINWHAPGEGLTPNGVRNPWLGTANAGPVDTKLRIHESTPDMVVQAVGATAAATTATFTPPAGSLLLVLWAGNTSTASGPSSPTITDSLGAHLTYTLTDWQSRADAPTRDGQAAAWTAPVTTSAPMTVSVSNSAISGDRAAGLQVLVLTGQHATTPVGAHGKAGSASTTHISQAYTAQGNGGQGFLALCDWDNTGVPRAGIDCYVAESKSAFQIPSVMSFGFFKRLIPDDVNTVSQRIDVFPNAVSTNLAWVYVEILPVPAGGGQTVAVGQVTETNTAQPITGGKRNTIGQVVETDTAQSITKRKAITIGQVTETDTAQPIAKIKQKLIGQVTETDTAQTITRVKARIIGQASETDTAQSITRVFVPKFIAVTQVVETSTAHAITRNKRKINGQVTEVDTAQPITVRKTRSVTQVTETNTAQSIAWKHVRLVARVTETDTSQSITARKTKAIGQVTETDTSQAITRKKTKTVGQVTETDTSQSITVRKAKTVIQVTETDTSQAITRKKTKLIGQVTETSTAQPFNRRKAKLIGQITETDTSQSITVVGAARVVNQVIETDTSQSITVRKTKAVGQITETDTSQPITRRKSKTVTQVIETNTAQSISRKKTVAVVQVTETDTSQPITRKKIKLIGQVTETNTAFAIVRRYIRTVNQVTETDTARAIQPKLRALVGMVTELDTAQPITLPGSISMGTVNRHRVYLLQKTVAGNTTYVKRRPAIIVGIASNSDPILRVKHTGEVYGNASVGVPPRGHPDANVVAVYVTY
jgi:hypothetical protein